MTRTPDLLALAFDFSDVQQGSEASGGAAKAAGSSEETSKSFVGSPRLRISAFRVRAPEVNGGS